MKRKENPTYGLKELYKELCVLRETVFIWKYRGSLWLISLQCLRLPFLVIRFLLRQDDTPWPYLIKDLQCIIIEI